MEVAFGTAGCNVTPVVVFWGFPEFREEIDYGDLELTGVDAVV